VSKKILLYRPGFLGDIVMSLAAVRMIKDCNPDATVAYAMWDQCQQLVRFCPWVDEVRRAGTYRLAEFDATCHFEHEKFGRERVYWGRLHARNAEESGLIPEGMSETADCRPVIWLDPRSRAWPELPAEYVVIHAWSTNGKNWRLWSLDKWEQLVQRIELPVVLLGTSSSPPVNGVEFDLRGQQDIMQDMWTVAGAKFCVALDSFIAHVAHAKKMVPGREEPVRDAVPTVLLNGPIHPKCIVPDGADCVVVSNYSGCGMGGPCGTSHGWLPCRFKNSCMAELSVEEIWNGIQKCAY